MIHFQGKPLNITVIQVYTTTTNAEKAKVERFNEDLLLELVPKGNAFFIIGDWNAKVGSQEIPGVTGKFALGVQHDAGQKLTEFGQENTVHSKIPIPTTQEMTLHMYITNGQYRNQIDYILCSQ